MNSPQRRMTPMRMSLILGAVVGCVACLVYVATFDHAPPSAARLCAGAGAWTAVATIAPIWLESLIINGGAFQLAVLSWRLVTMLGGLLIAQTFAVEARNCFLTALMVCYFVALPLESHLLARNANANR
jgi:hypothetical protein